MYKEEVRKKRDELRMRRERDEAQARVEEMWVPRNDDFLFGWPPQPPFAWWEFLEI